MRVVADEKRPISDVGTRTQTSHANYEINSQEKTNATQQWRRPKMCVDEKNETKEKQIQWSIEFSSLIR